MFHDKSARRDGTFSRADFDFDRERNWQYEWLEVVGTQ
jgi:hypothetical protein